MWRFASLLSLIDVLLRCVPFTYEPLSILAIRNLSPAGSPYAPRNLPSLLKQGRPCCKGVYEWGDFPWLMIQIVRNIWFACLYCFLSVAFVRLKLYLCVLLLQCRFLLAVTVLYGL